MGEIGYMLCKKIEIKMERQRTGITMKDVADYMNVSESTLWRWIRRNDSDKSAKILETIKTIELLK